MSNITELTCRVCLKEQQVLINVFDELEELQTNLSCLLDKCGDLQVEENDLFPKYLCEECTRELLISAKFRDKCAKSKEILEKVVKENSFYHDESQTTELCTKTEENDYLAIASEEIESTTEPIIENVPQLFGGNFDNSEDNYDVDRDSANSTPSNLEEATVDDATVSYHETSDVDVEQDEPASVEYDCNPIKNNGHEVVDIDLSGTTFMNSLPLKGKQLKSFKCNICGAAFAQAINLQKHFQKTHPGLDDNYSKGDTRKQISETNTSKKCMESQRRCIYCDRQFQTPFALRMHLRTHTGERPFPCQYCDKAFKTQSSLSIHIKRHTGQADFVCNFCGKSFYERGNLSVHMRSHNGERPHECTICQKTFSRVFLLELHIRTHTGEKPFTCSFCDRSFRQRSDWKNHLTTHTGNKQYTCHLCSKGYTKRASLVHHMRIHSQNSVLQIDLEEVCEVEQSEIVHCFDNMESEEILE